MNGRRTKFFRAAGAVGAVSVLVATVSAAAATTATGSGSVASRPTASAVSGQTAGTRNGRWIAYSTAPASDVDHAEWGSDVFVTRVGGPETEPVADRGQDRLWNVCPAFSPNGRMLAFARVTNEFVWNRQDRSRIVIVRFGAHGPVAGGRIVLNVRAGRAHCPVWSSDSSRLAYLDHGRVVVRDLHGVRRHRSVGDPTRHDFDRSVDELVSPTGDLVARQGPDGTIVSRPDGSDQRVIQDDYAHTIAGWSPDGRKLLLVDDYRGAWFRIRTVSVDPPFASETVVDSLPDNGTRSQLPGYNDVSWQPIPDHLASAAGSPPAVAQLHAGGSTATAAAGWPPCPAIYPGDVVRQKLSGNVCGPRRVIPGVNYSFTVVVTNISNKTFHPFTLHISHYDPFTRTSRPYRRTKAQNGDPIMKGAAWTVKRLRPRQSLRISFTLPFRRHNDPKGSNFDVAEIGTHDVVFVKPK